MTRHLEYSILINKKKNEQHFNHHRNQWATVEKEYYKGKIVCLSLDKNYLMLVRKNGLTVWSGNTVAGGSALTSGKPHQMVVAGTSGVLYITNGRYVAEWNGTTATDDSFDTEDADSVIVSIAWNQNRLWIAANKPNVSGRNEASVYIWDGNSPSWESQIKIGGKVGALYVKNGITFVFYKRTYLKELLLWDIATELKLKI